MAYATTEVSAVKAVREPVSFVWFGFMPNTSLRTWPPGKACQDAAAILAAAVSAAVSNVDLFCMPLLPPLLLKAMQRRMPLVTGLLMTLLLMMALLKHLRKPRGGLAATVCVARYEALHAAGALTAHAYASSGSVVNL